VQDIVRDKLAELIGRFGLDLCDDPRRCEALLRDVCGEHRREINALVSATREGVGTELRQSSTGVPKELIVARLTKRLHEDVGIAEDLARWAVETWAIALGLATATEFRFPFKCPKCGAQRNLATRLAGQKIRCPQCSTILFIADNGREVFSAPDPQELSHNAVPPAVASAGSKSEVLRKPTPASVASTAKTSSAIARPSPTALPSAAETSRTPDTSTTALRPSADTAKATPTIVRDEISGRELRSNEQVAQLFGPLCERTTLPEDTVRKVRSHLTEWADKIPHHKFRDFGMLLQIREALYLPHYSITLTTQYETRTVKRVEVLYTGSIPPAAQVTESNIKVWSYSWPLVKEFRAGEEKYSIDSSQEVVACGTCRGSGKVTCPTCSGKGHVQCQNCKGSGWIEQSRTVLRMRPMVTYDARGRGQMTMAPFPETEYYNVQCTTCATTGAVPCPQCKGSRTVQCSICRGSGKMVSLLVVTDSFAPADDLLVHLNPLCAEDVKGLIDNAADYRRVVSILADKIDCESLGAMCNTPLREAVNSVLTCGLSRCSDKTRIVSQRLCIDTADVLEIKYDFQGAPYDLYIVGKEWTVHAPTNPFVKLIENSAAWAKQKLETGKVADGLKMLNRCLEMGQADHVVESVLRPFCDRLADAYAREAAAYGKWWAESLYYSDRAKQMQPAHPAASAHEKAVTRWLGGIAFLPGVCAGIVTASLGFANLRPDVGTIGLVTPIVLSILLWFFYGRKARSTALMILLSFVGAAMASVILYVIGTTPYPTQETAWLYSGSAGAMLSVGMIVITALLPKSLRREHVQVPKDLRLLLSLAQKSFQEDWEDIQGFVHLASL